MQSQIEYQKTQKTGFWTLVSFSCFPIWGEKDNWEIQLRWWATNVIVHSLIFLNLGVIIERRISMGIWTICLELNVRFNKDSLDNLERQYYIFESRFNIVNALEVKEKFACWLYKVLRKFWVCNWHQGMKSLKQSYRILLVQVRKGYELNINSNQCVAHTRVRSC